MSHRTNEKVAHAFEERTQGRMALFDRRNAPEALLLDVGRDFGALGACARLVRAIPGIGLQPRDTPSS